MLLAIDVGNTQIYMGVFDGDKIKSTFRCALADDIIESFKANNIAPRGIKEIAIASVVPALTPGIEQRAEKYFGVKPFVVKSGVKTSLILPGYGTGELGADRVADIEGALHLYPGKNLIVMDFGTANTFCAVSGNGEYKGGAISAGIAMSMNALANGAALLSKVEIKNPGYAAGMDTTTQLQAGIFYAGLGAAKEIRARLAAECFKNAPYFTVGTGGLGRLYEHEGIFDIYTPDLVLTGLRILAEKNK